MHQHLKASQPVPICSLPDSQAEGAAVQIWNIAAAASQHMATAQPVDVDKTLPVWALGYHGAPRTCGCW